MLSNQALGSADTHCAKIASSNRILQTKQGKLPTITWSF